MSSSLEWLLYFAICLSDSGSATVRNGSAAVREAHLSATFGKTAVPPAANGQLLSLVVCADRSFDPLNPL